MDVFPFKISFASLLFIHSFHLASYRWDQSVHWMTLIFILAKGLRILFNEHIFCSQLNRMISWFLVVKWPWKNAPLFLCLRDTLEWDDLVHHHNSLGGYKSWKVLIGLRYINFKAQWMKHTLKVAFMILYTAGSVWCVFVFMMRSVLIAWASHRNHSSAYYGI